MAYITLRDVHLAFGGPALLDGAHFNLERGERVCLIGRNGEGKSTLLKLIEGSLLPDTGEVSIPMLKSVGVGHVIIGHSERRQYFAESDAFLAEKVDATLEGGLTPIFCCGETLEQRNEGIDEHRRPA